ncbi:hypothetical protein PC128_g6869 [Phytophthora cactorum]|nr:hypothetical protein PC128_g6869 [Phytophthora cactorum]KAG4057115.1 hypothetical protein PC123_g7855 [Phytophthora cactorum]
MEFGGFQNGLVESASSRSQEDDTWIAGEVSVVELTLPIKAQMGNQESKMEESIVCTTYHDVENNVEK